MAKDGLVALVLPGAPIKSIGLGVGVGFAVTLEPLVVTLRAFVLALRLEVGVRCQSVQLGDHRVGEATKTLQGALKPRPALGLRID